MRQFYNAVFTGNFEKVKQYLTENFEDGKWNCPTGEEDLSGIIDTLYAGAYQPGVEKEIIFEVDFYGNIKCQGDVDTFANIVEDINN